MRSALALVGRLPANSHSDCQLGAFDRSVDGETGSLVVALAGLTMMVGRR